jgi:hypothetical protein
VFQKSVEAKFTIVKIQQAERGMEEVFRQLTIDNS